MGDVIVSLFCDQAVLLVIFIARPVYWQLGINNEYTCGLPFYDMNYNEVLIADYLRKIKIFMMEVLGV